MWHRGYGRRRFRGSWFFWIFGTFFFLSLFGKTGVLPYIFPFVLFWLVGPMLWGIFAGSHPRARRRRLVRPPVHMPPPQRREPPPAEIKTQRKETEPKPSPAGPGIYTLGSHCRACGGPIDHTTVEWRGRSARCGYCGTGLGS